MGRQVYKAESPYRFTVNERIEVPAKYGKKAGHPIVHFKMTRIGDEEPATANIDLRGEAETNKWAPVKVGDTIIATAYFFKGKLIANVHKPVTILEKAA